MASRAAAFSPPPVLAMRCAPLAKVHTPPVAVCSPKACPIAAAAYRIATRLMRVREAPLPSSHDLPSAHRASSAWAGRP
eukprot:CAMPEP_0174751868 /NCGR_PEP_ID=MMETSP1094-20130205/100727_1 /TAXON_ID=156173 /ORGANISM="Chrysochromulina brevifilum, Strain UTEX LB 985" /LENGTH=78 /DNA_ID=CAMNT_0015957413 /DNA_START=176 /DNA_END=408 /DNA_ORIENTATION=-